MAKRARVKDEIEEQDKTKEADLISVETAVAVLSNLPLSVQDCTLSDKEKAYAIKCAKLSLLEKDGQQARSEYIRREMEEMLGGDWSCVVGGYGGGSSGAPHIKFRYGEHPIWVMKNDLAAHVPLIVKRCDMEEDMEQDAIRTIQYALNVYKEDMDRAATYISKEFNARHKKCWGCFIAGPDGGSHFEFVSDGYMWCTRGELTIELFKRVDQEEDGPRRRSRRRGR